MKKRVCFFRTGVFVTLLLLCFKANSYAQFTVIDPTNFAQGIINSTNEIVETATTAENMISTFHETKKIYNQSKEYYDKLRAVNHLIRDARKVQQSILMLGEISEIYVKSFDRMLNDKNLTPRELSAIAFGYARLLQESTHAITELKGVINPSDLSMTDKERLDVVDKVYNTLLKYRSLTSYYTSKTISVSLLRSQQLNNTRRTMSLYGSAEQKYW